ncbi:MAG: KH domain-containing protein [Thainema sp.]
MSSNNSKPESAENSVVAASSPVDFTALTRFLLEPLVESSDSLKIDCEASATRGRVLIRVAFDGEDKGRVFGRGGRNIQAVRTILGAVAQLSGYSAHLDVHGSSSSGNDGDSRERSHRSSSNHRSKPRPDSGRRSRPKPRDN